MLTTGFLDVEQAVFNALHGSYSDPAGSLFAAVRGGEFALDEAASRALVQEGLGRSSTSPWQLLAGNGWLRRRPLSAGDLERWSARSGEQVTLEQVVHNVCADLLARSLSDYLEVLGFGLTLLPPGEQLSPPAFAIYGLLLWRYFIQGYRGEIFSPAYQLVRLLDAQTAAWAGHYEDIYSFLEELVPVGVLRHDAPGKRPAYYVLTERVREALLSWRDLEGSWRLVDKGDGEVDGEIRREIARLKPLA